MTSNIGIIKGSAKWAGFCRPAGGLQSGWIPLMCLFEGWQAEPFTGPAEGNSDSNFLSLVWAENKRR